MAVAKILSASVVGLEAVPIEVEADISNGLPAFNIVGLADKAVEESKERVRAALKNSSAKMVDRRLTVNLAPADLPKSGPAFDLPIAVGILIATEQVPSPLDYQKTLFIGELSLDGKLRKISGVLSMTLLAKEKGIENIFLPEANLKEAQLVEGINLFPVSSLKALIYHLKQEKLIHKPKNKIQLFQEPKEDLSDFDMAYIKGQEQAKRALEIAAAGMHNVLFSGPPGAGKTLLARAMPSIMPQMLEQEALEVTKIYSVSGFLSSDSPLISIRPFRSPHHTASNISLVGGGQRPKPGEVTLAHKGVLFLDELPEFGRSVLEALRQPLEDRVITISRASGTLQFPAHFILLAAMNPCPCGFLNDPKKECLCSPNQVLRYQKRVSGPLLDRIDINIEVPQVKYEKLVSEQIAEKSNNIRERVEKALQKQRSRFGDIKIHTNSEMKVQDIKRFCRIDNKSKELLKQAVDELNLSARLYHRMIKLARTIADLEGNNDIQIQNIAEALQYRPKQEYIT